MADIQHITTAGVAPSAAPAGVGHHYVDTVNKKAYISVGTTTVADWIDVSASSGGAGGGSLKTRTVAGMTTLNTDVLLNESINYDYVMRDDLGATISEYIVNIYADFDTNAVLNQERVFTVRLPRLAMSSKYRINTYGGTGSGDAGGGGCSMYLATDVNVFDPAVSIDYIELKSPYTQNVLITDYYAEIVFKIGLFWDDATQGNRIVAYGVVSEYTYAFLE